PVSCRHKVSLSWNRKPVYRVFQASFKFYEIYIISVVIYFLVICCSHKKFLKTFAFAFLVFVFRMFLNKSPFFFNLSPIVCIVKSPGFIFGFISFQSSGVDTVGSFDGLAEYAAAIVSASSF